MKLEFYGKVNDGGQLHIIHRSVFDAIMSKNIGKEFIITFLPRKKLRSNPQNRYYWGIIIPFFQQGFFETQGEHLSTNEVHEFIKFNFNYKEMVNENTGEVVRVSSTTTDKTTTEFGELIDKCIIFADTFFNITIPLPEEQSKMF
jgi:hypothetical protein